jgi:hypothetical protein
MERWSQLAANDNQSLVKNLRGIGCPEPILFAIVTATVDPLYQQKRTELEQQLDAYDQSSWSVKLEKSADQQQWLAALAKLPYRETVEIDELLGINPPPDTRAIAQAASQNDSATMAAANDVSDDSASFPLALQKPNLANLKLTPEQTAAIENVRQQFINDIGGTNQDPNNPDYLARWQQAQPKSDTLLRGWLGHNAYMSYGMAVQQNNQAPATTGNQ